MLNMNVKEKKKRRGKKRPETFRALPRFVIFHRAPIKGYH